MDFRVALLWCWIVLFPAALIAQQTEQGPQLPAHEPAEAIAEPQALPSLADESATTLGPAPETEKEPLAADAGTSAVTPSDQQTTATESAATPPNGATPAEEVAAVVPATDGAEATPQPPAWDGDENPFPTAAVIETQKAFWIEIFTRYTSQQGLIHDRRFTQPIYEAVDLRKESRRRQYRFTQRRKRAIALELRRAAEALEKGEAPSENGQRLLELLPENAAPGEIRKYAANVRFQRGLADRFKQGLIQSGAVLERIREILAAEGVPPDLAYLPHVESSFDRRTHSRFGAAGIWQFTRGTGRLFLTIRYEVDERLDPLLATEAAAKFLRQNYDRLGSWPLAITAYNHGPVGMQRIVNRLGTRELATMITDYDGRLFKFASKNFYAEFLAAREVATHYEKFFGELELKKPLAFRKVKLPFFLDFGAAVRVLGVKEKFLADLNPSLRMPVLVGAKHIPSGFHLQVPPHVHPQEFLRSIPANARADTQKRTFEIVVRRGDSLYSLGRRYKVPWRVIARANFITAYHRIRPGQRLMIPWRGQTGDWVAKRDDRAKAKTVPKTLVAAVIASRKAAPDKTRKVDDESIAFQAAEGASLFQDLEVRNFSTNAQMGEIVAAYGETLGHYAAWAGVSTQEIRDYNGFSYRRILKPGSLLLIPFHKMTPTAFNQQRFEYHHIRESDFYSSYGVIEVVKVKVRRGDSPWEIAQENDVPMWLFYQSNPALIETELRPGMTVSLPVIEALAVLEGPGEGGSTAPLN